MNVSITDSGIFSLFINVWAPANATADSNLPVKVWLYGGANEAGGISNPTYDGCFANENTIQVSISYRLVSCNSKFPFCDTHVSRTWRFVEDIENTGYEVLNEMSAL